ncbi:MAG: hypothetical protein A2076_17140 [Geobacteraceae bacterium GWC2_53_11]|nr:MAG: hypothetical protein A2076_17140 [Geobacteraceae bacterium GWC2_53_11]
MRNIGLSKLQNLLFVLFLFALTGCGASNSNIAGTEGATGKITAKFDWAADGKSTAKTVAAVPTGVLSVRLKVTGPTVNGTTYTRVKASFPAADGGGTVAVTPGTKLIVTAEALGAGDVLLYEGFKREVTVTSGATTDLGTISMAAPYYKVADEPCLGCHENSRGITGQSIVADYKGSRHYSVTVSPVPNFNGTFYANSTGCAGCHGQQHNDLNPALGFNTSRCYSCHSVAGNFPAHKAEYQANKTSCTACHQAHKLEFQQVPDLAASGHGTATKPAWTEYDFSTRTDCIACHNPLGFANAVNSNWTNTAATNTGKSALTCDTCHTSATQYHNNIRTITGGYTAGMGGFATNAKATIVFPDVNQSNVCVPCHASRENGKSVALGVTDFTNASFKNPHYLAAAAVFYGTGGFQFYSSASQTQYQPQAYTSKYGVVVDGTVIKAAAASTSNSTPAIAVGDALVGDKAPWSHGKLGMNNFQTTISKADVIAAKGNLVFTGTAGQCVACHLGPEQTHSFDAYKGAEATWKTGTATANSMANGTFAGCYGCHTNEDIKEVAELDEKPKYDAAMDFFKWQLAQNGAVYSEAYPYFFKADGVTALKNWIAADTTTGMVVTNGNGPANMGAALNFKLLKAEKGAHVHNRTFMKQLIFDSIQYLQTGNVSFSNRNIAAGATADPDGLINFKNYSTSLISTGKAGATTQTVRGYITRKNTSAPTAGLYTRP